MSCPHFEIQKNADFENIAEIINADNEPKHFIRQRTYTPVVLSDDNIRSAFGKKIRHSQSGYFSALRFLSIIFPLMIAVSIYVMVAAATEKRLSLLAIPMTALLFGILWGIFLFCHAVEFAFIKSVSDLFILYDKENKPCSVEISKKQIRVLYAGTLYVIKGKKIKTIRKERKLYYAYLNMFPQSVLDMGKYVDNSDTYLQPVLIPYINYLPDGSCALSFRLPGALQLQNSSASRDKSDGGETYNIFPLLRRLTVWRRLHFCKYIFTVNNQLKLTSVYSAARENAVINYDALTLSTVTESGEEAIKTLKLTAIKSTRLAELLNNIDLF